MRNNNNETVRVYTIRLDESFDQRLKTFYESLPDDEEVIDKVTLQTTNELKITTRKKAQTAKSSVENVVNKTKKLLFD